MDVLLAVLGIAVIVLGLLDIFRTSRAASWTSRGWTPATA